MSSPDRRAGRVGAEWALEADAILQWLVARDFTGYDPFDALESPFFVHSPFARSALARIGWIQFHKRSPLNFRRLLLVPRTRNPKGLGLVLTGLARRGTARGMTETALGERVVEWLAAARAPASAGWGYPFAWQNRSFYAPRGTPNAICTAFVANGLLDYAAASGSERAVDVAVGTLPFWTTELRRTFVTGSACFSYTPGDNSRIHNVNLLAAATLSRLGRQLGESRLLEMADQSLEFSMAAQRPDGSWLYGDGPRQRWIDGFHTGFNLGALRQLGELLDSDAARSARRRGYAYFKRELLDSAGRPRYYAGRGLYPIDVHAVAQAVVTVLEASDLEPEALPLATEIARWTHETLGLGPGRYAYQRGRLLRNRIVYARWGQAWMFRALAELEGALAGREGAVCP